MVNHYSARSLITKIILTFVIVAVYLALVILTGCETAPPCDPYYAPMAHKAMGCRP